MKSAKELVAEGNARVKTILPADAESLLNAADKVFIDLRHVLNCSAIARFRTGENRGALEFSLDPALP